MSPRTRVRVLAAVCLLSAGGCTIVSSEPGPGGAGGGYVPSGDAGAAGSSSGSGTSSGGSGSGGFGGADASSCTPGSVSTFHPGSYTPASGAYQGLCVPDAKGDPIARFYAACLGNDASTDDCNAFSADYAACVGCLLTPETATAYGPLINHGTFVTANVAGCVELVGETQPDASQLFCASAVQALADCELDACQANCAVHDGESLSAFETCATNTASGGCATYADAATCADADADAGTLGSACLADFDTFYSVVAPHFCGVAPAGTGLDAGAPVPAGDASAD